MITLKGYITADGKFPAFQGAWLSHPDRDQLEKDANKLIVRVNSLLQVALMPDVEITSGWRTVAHNFAIGGAQNSKHLFAMAVDLFDPDKKIGEWCQSHVESLKDLGLYMESLTTTHAAVNRMKRWVHLQSVAPRSGNIIFIP